MPPIAEDTPPSQDDLNNAEDLEGEESDEYDVEDEEGDDSEEYEDEGDDEGEEGEQNGQHSNLTALLLGGGEVEDDEEYSEAEAGVGLAPVGSVKRIRDGDEEGDEDGDDEQDPKKLKV